jgi:hypothetical protein
MIRFPKRHLADETMARILVAAERTRGKQVAKEGPDDLELVDFPPAPESGGPDEAAGDAAPPMESTGAALDSSGLDVGMVAQGADSFDALTKGMSNV